MLTAYFHAYPHCIFIFIVIVILHHLIFIAVVDQCDATWRTHCRVRRGAARASILHTPITSSTATRIKLLTKSNNRKTEHPGFVETPTRRTTRSRASATPAPESETNGNGHIQSTEASNGHAKSNGFGELKKGQIIDGWEVGKDPKIDYSGKFEFGGDLGCVALMVGFPALMYYMWIGATYYDGGFPRPAAGQSFGDFVRHLGDLIYTGAFPSLKAWTIYWTFFIVEGAMYILLPGFTTKGKPLAHEGGMQLTYHCSAVWSFYVTILAAIALHFTGLFPLWTLIDEFGPLLSVAIISGFIVSVIAYFSALARGAQHRMTGHPIYDFFMGAELNPRMFGILDFKMFFEVRLPWYILFLLSVGTAARQYELYGYVSGEVGFLVMAHFLYANACSKGEECITTTW